MKPQLVIFDWAGTTVDYGCFAPVNAFALAFQKFGVTPTVEEIRAPMGMLKRDHAGHARHPAAVGGEAGRV